MPWTALTGYLQMASGGMVTTRISGKNAKVIPGYKIMLAICDRAARKGEKVGFLGSTPK